MSLKVITAQTGGRQFNAPDFTKYSLFVGGVNATHHSLLNYSPLMNGFGRLFMVRPPTAIVRMFATNSGEYYSPNSLFIQFKHMLEYMNRSVAGFQEKQLESASTPIQGGFAGRQFNTPTVTKETTNEFTVGLYELIGSPVYTVIDGWMNAIGDENSGLATYGGLISGGRNSDEHETRLYTLGDDDNREAIAFNEAEHTAEFIYVLHDRSGTQVERAVLLADCYPKSIAQGVALDMPAGGTHDNVAYDITFNCVVYRSPIITAIANDLLKQYRIISNSLNFNPQLGDAVYGDGELFNSALGEIPLDNSDGGAGDENTRVAIGNIPVYYSTNAPITYNSSQQDISNSNEVNGTKTENATIAPTTITVPAPKLAGQTDHKIKSVWTGIDLVQLPANQTLKQDASTGLYSIETAEEE